MPYAVPDLTENPVSENGPKDQAQNVETGAEPLCPWSIRDAVWALCLEAGLFALLFNVNTILGRLGVVVERTGPGSVGRLMVSAGAAYPIALIALSRAFSGPVVAWRAASEFGVSVREFGVRKPDMSLRWGFLFTVGLAAVYLGGGTLLLYLRPSWAAALAPRAAIRGMGLHWAVVAFCISAPIGEEVIYRGILYPSLRNRLGVWKAMLLSAAVFAVMHNILSVSLFLPVTQFAGGLILAYAYEKSNSLLLPVVYHACGNSLLFLAHWLTRVPV